MSQAEELLNNTSLDDISLYTAEPETEEHIIVGHDRRIIVPEALKRIAVQYDHNVETVTFDCPRYWDDNDLSTMNIYISYLRPDNMVGMYIVDNVRIDKTNPRIIHFEWTIGDEISMVSGPLKFSISAKRKTDSDTTRVRWYSEINSEMFVSEGMDSSDVVVSENPDIINDLVSKMNSVLSANNPILDTSLTQFGLAADAGVTGDRFNKERIDRKEAIEKEKNERVLAVNNEAVQRQESDELIRNELLIKINSVASGSPIAADSINDMTDTSRIYVNTTDGKWYYHDGSKWNVGGDYQSPVDSKSVELLLGKTATQAYFSSDEVTELFGDGSYKTTKFNYNTITEIWYTSGDEPEFMKTTTIRDDYIIETINQLPIS